MAHSSNSHAEPAPRVPAALINRHRAGWHAFTGALVKACAAIAVVLLLMLIFLRIL